MNKPVCDKIQNIYLIILYDCYMEQSPRKTTRYFWLTRDNFWRSVNGRTAGKTTKKPKIKGQEKYVEHLLKEK